MKKRTAKKGFPIRMLALLLCCFCLIAALPTYAAEDATEPTETLANTPNSGDNTPNPGEDPSDKDTLNTSNAGDNTAKPEGTPATQPDPNQSIALTNLEGENPSLLVKLTDCNTCKEMYDILDEAPLADVDALGYDELTILIDHAKTLPDDGYKSDLLLDLYHLRDGNAQSLGTYTATATIQQGSSGTAQFSNTAYWRGNETWTVTPAASGITVSASGYINQVTVTVGSGVEAGTYTLTCTKTDIFSNSSNTYTITLTVTSSSSGGSSSTDDADFIITNYMENTQVAYVDFKPNQSTSYTLTEIANGQTVYGSGSDGDGVLVFFIKPRDGYLLTEFVNAAGADCDMYSTTVSASESRIQYFRNNSTEAQKIIDAASEQGYLGYYGFTYSGKSYSAASYSTKAERPQMTVTAVADKTTGVKPGDTVTYTVTITPGHTTAGNDTVTGVNITSMTINGEEVSYTSLVANSDGTYTTTVTRTVTQEDWASGDVTLMVDASVNYSYEITVKDRNNRESKIPTTATVPNSAEVSVPVAPKNGVRYVVTHEPSDKVVPDITKTVPIDTGSYFEGDTINVNTTYGTANPAEGEPANVVDDPTNGGTWTFNGWYKDEALTQKANATETKTGEGATIFYGKWTFAVYPTYKLTVTKVLDGNFFNLTDTFSFTIDYEGVADVDKTFTLGKDQSKEFTVSYGKTVTITETNTQDYNFSLKSITADLSQTVDENAHSVSFTMPQKDVTVVIQNEKSITPQTGVILDALPYILILAIVAGGVVLMLLRKRRSYED